MTTRYELGEIVSVLPTDATALEVIRTDDDGRQTPMYLLLRPVPAPAEQPTRYFKHVKGFGDRTAYVCVEADDRGYCVLLDGKRGSSWSGGIKEALRNCRSHESNRWQEITEAEAKALLKPSEVSRLEAELKAKQNALVKLEAECCKLKGVVAAIKAQLAEVEA